MKLLTLDDCAELTAIPKSTLRQWAKENKFPAFKVERHWRVDEEDLNNWLVGKKERGAVTPLSTDDPTNLHLASEKGGMSYDYINRP
jgi:excisionase family DNA binding protein